MILVFIHLILYYTAHSLLASLWIKRLLGACFPAARFYRRVYNIISLAWLSYILWMAWRSPVLILESHPIAGLVYMLMGVFLLARSLWQINLGAFLGLAEEDNESAKLMVSGWYGVVRHPLYLDIIFSLVGLCLWNFSSLTAGIFIITFVYILIGIRLEEKKLTAAYGDAYRQYQKNVWALIPYLY